MLSEEAKARLVALYQEMYELTVPECASSCPVPRSCCSPEYCESTIRYAKEYWGTTLTPTGHDRLPLMGPTGCTAAPHLRPMCTLHTCDINSFGLKMRPKPDVKWSHRYFQIRADIERLEALR